MTLGPTKRRTAPKTTVKAPVTINPTATLDLLKRMVVDACDYYLRREGEKRKAASEEQLCYSLALC